VVTFTPGGALESGFREVCPVHVLPKSAATEARVLLDLARILARPPAALLHASLFPANWRGALVATLNRRLPFIASVRNLTDWMGSGRRFVEGLVLRRAQAVIVNSEAIARDLVAHGGVRRRNLHVIPNGVDLDRFHPAERAPRPGEGSESDEVIVGAVMSLTRKKNPGLLVEAARRVISARPATRFVVAGDGPLRGEMLARIAAAGLEGRFHLAGLRRDVPDFLRSIDMLALTSDREGLPNVVLEAMATGIPVVATSVGGTPEIVRDEVTGRLVPPGDPEAFARAVLTILGVRGAAVRMGEEGRRSAAAFGVARMVERTEALYESVLHPASGRDARAREEPRAEERP